MVLKNLMYYSPSSWGSDRVAAEEIEAIWGLSVGHWHAITGIGTVALTLATVGLAAVAWYQIAAARTEAISARAEAKRTRTLEVVSRYDHDPVLDRALRRMARARDSRQLFDNTRLYRTDIVAIMNYFESIAIGLQQDIYIAEMVRDYMESIVRSHIDEIEKEKIFDKIGSDPDDFEHICALNKRWKKSQMHFKGG
jgi:hypothetical protein